MRKPIVAGNWKMNTTLSEGRDLVQALLAHASSSDTVETVAIPPFTWIVPLSELVADSGLGLGAQDCATEDQGAFTGEVSAKMLAPYCRYVIVGHSERRHILGEDDDVVRSKLQAVLRNNLTPILCVGELLEERERGEAQAVVERQLRRALDGLSPESLERLVVAYEPVWAIGTGRAATADDAQEMASAVRRVLADIVGSNIAGGVRIQYGGSVSAQNASELLRLPDVDGALVGGASLKPQDFGAIIDAAVALVE